jgi:hypothetical protein
VGGDTYMDFEDRMAMTVEENADPEEGVKFYIAAYVPVVSGQTYKALFSREIKQHTIRKFGFKRQFVSSSITDYQSMVGKANDASWNGLATGTVKYLGAKYEMKANVVTVDYFFMWRAELWVDVFPPPLMGHATSNAFTAQSFQTVNALQAAGVACRAAWNRDSFGTFGF